MSKMTEKSGEPHSQEREALKGLEGCYRWRPGAIRQTAQPKQPEDLPEAAAEEG